MNLRLFILLLIATPVALAQAPLPTKDKPAAKPAAAKPVATVNGVAVPQARADFLLQQQLQRGAQDNEQMRGMVRD